MLNKISLPELCSGKDLKIDNNLKKLVQESNMKFNNELTKYQVDKIAKRIVDKHK
jgi:hypothetical protein